MILPYEKTPYNGAFIDNSNITTDVTLFKTQLEMTIKEVREKGLRLIWLELPNELSILVNTVIETGFEFHHAQKGKITLTYKVFDDSFVPEYATHYIGAGGVVIDEKSRLLVIQEKLHKIKHYKLPGGTLDPGEHISTAVCREVLEETGIKTEFLGVSCFRHFHGYKFGKSDIYFVCRLKPLSKEIHIDTREIDKAIWMPVEDYLNDPDTHIFNKKIVETALNGEGLKRESIPGYRSDETHEMMF